MLNNTDISTENKQKVVLITDIFKAGKLLAAYFTEFEIYLNPTSFMFDCLYDKSVKELENIQLNLQIELNSAIYRIIIVGDSKI